MKHFAMKYSIIDTGNNLKKIMAQKLLVLFAITCLIASYSPFFHLNIFDSFQVKLQTRVRQTDRQTCGRTEQ